MRYNFAELFTAVAGAMPDRECVVFRDRRLTYAAVADRANRLANLLLLHGITIRRPRSDLSPWESGQDHVALYLHNGNEYIEGMLGAALARAASFNVNYRYVEAELAYLLNDADTRAIIYHARFAPLLGAILGSLRQRPALLLQVADESGHALLPGALDYEAALAGSRPDAPGLALDPDDLYIVYTGGTTGMPKGTLWPQGAIMEAGFAAFLPPGLFAVPTFADGMALIRGSTPTRLMPLPPLIHAAAQWMAMSAFLSGNTIVFPDVVDRLDPPGVWDAIDREGVQIVNLVGNAFASPMCDAFEVGNYSGRSLQFVGVGGAVTSASVKDRILRLLPQAVVGDVAGSSESGSQLVNLSTSGQAAVTGLFTPGAGSCVVSDDYGRVLEPGDPEPGWLARHGPIPFGYLGDRDKTSRTFFDVAGRRMVVQGDRARHHADGLIELLGRESVTINSGGEKIFAEEVEEALYDHPAIRDVIVVGRPSERWGQEVVAVVELVPDQAPSDEDLRVHAGQRLARYKLPKGIVRVASVLRGPTGKADYGWARKIAAEAARP
jgi:3-oxocholest-4-en-26-oate---CoA ligase